jgi:hypothetical protein
MLEGEAFDALVADIRAKGSSLTVATVLARALRQV